MRLTGLVMGMLMLVCANVPAGAADTKTFNEQAEAWCRWMGIESSDKGADPTQWPYGCSKVAAPQGSAPLTTSVHGEHREYSTRLPVHNTPETISRRP